MAICQDAQCAACFNEGLVKDRKLQREREMLLERIILIGIVLVEQMVKLIVIKMLCRVMPMNGYQCVHRKVIDIYFPSFSRNRFIIKNSMKHMNTILAFSAS